MQIAASKYKKSAHTQQKSLLVCVAIIVFIYFAFSGLNEHKKVNGN